MALALLDGTIAAVDFKIAPTVGGTEASIKCIANYISLMYRRGTTLKTTFCSGNWADPIPGLRQGFGHIDGFASTGAAYSTPLLYFSVDAPLAFTFTADTGNTIAHKLVQTQEAMGVRALGEFARGIDFETSGIPAVTWVVA